MNRRKFLKRVTTATAGGFGLNLLGSACQMQKNQPNILLIHTDQHRIDCLGVKKVNPCQNLSNFLIPLF